ncbi:hypothetical protein S40293_02129 [Stachybotrys chartarum IBT 40293]|nr:hypothetical protein S40293_02129 [Stachybotrys chartarum IBT 40293]
MDKKTCSMYPRDEEKQTLLPEQPDHGLLARASIFDDGRPGVVWLCHGVLLSISATMLAMTLLMRFGQPSDLYFARPYSPHSPAFSSMQYQTLRYNITPTALGSEYVGYGPKVDEAWNAVTADVGDHVISPDDLRHLGLDASSITAEDGATGTVGYRAGVQVFRQLHCLNLLRQNSFRDYYGHRAGYIAVPQEKLRMHLDHCLEMLRTTIMCESDVSIFTYKSYDDVEGHWPDLNTVHTCRNFDAVRDWASKKALKALQKQEPEEEPVQDFCTGL